MIVPTWRFSSGLRWQTMNLLGAGCTGGRSGLGCINPRACLGETLSSRWGSSRHAATSAALPPWLSREVLEVFGSSFHVLSNGAARSSHTQTPARTVPTQVRRRQPGQVPGGILTGPDRQGLVALVRLWSNCWPGSRAPSLGSWSTATWAAHEFNRGRWGPASRLADEAGGESRGRKQLAGS